MSFIRDFYAILCLFLTNTLGSPTSPNSLLTSSLGNGLVDIAALTTLIGSSTAESLALGDRGTAGQAWGVMSTFGMLSVIKACITGVSPGWIRETLGVRSKISDLALGVSLHLGRGSLGSEKARKNLGDAIAISCKNPQGTPDDVSSDVISARCTWNDIYTFDQSTLNIVNSFPASRAEDALQIFTYVDYQFFPYWNSRQDWLAVLLSMLKSIEVYVLWLEKAWVLCWVGSIPWFYFMSTAVIHLLYRLSRPIATDPTLNENIDIVTGALPTTKRAGHDRKIILGVADASRVSAFQRLVWGIGAVVCSTSLMATYMILGQADPRIVSIWTAFQIVWLMLRILFFHLAETIDPMAHRMLMPIPWEKLTSSQKGRVLELTLALAQYQIYGHPRGPWSYKEDEMNAARLNQHFLSAEYHLRAYFPLDKATPNESTVDVTVSAIVGDPVLTSAAWIRGSKLTGMDLYDSCLVIFQIKDSVICVPSARVLAGKLTSVIRHDIEKSETPYYVPKGSSNTGKDITWFYWIPCQDGRWLQILTEDMKILGKRKAEVFSGVQVSRKLAAGDLNISLSKVEELEAIVHTSMHGGRSLMQFYS